MGSFNNVFIFGVLHLIFACFNAIVGAIPETFNLIDFGARGDGLKDDTQAFIEGWNAVCQAQGPTATLVIPAGKTFFLSPQKFSGPCKPETIFFQIDGTIVAPNRPAAWTGLDAGRWIVFEKVNGINVQGKGTLDGRGKGWWDQSCRYHPQLTGCTKLAPTSISFLSQDNGKLQDIRIVNSPQAHILLMGINGFDVHNVHINSPETSPNTDGLHLQDVHHVTITNSEFHCGDDCISIGDHCNDIKVDHVDCGPGHGVSIGSLGSSGNEVQVEDIHVSNVNFHGTTNGVRIKTYQVGRGYARGFSFSNINFTAVQNPIMIDQYYCSVAGACKAEKTGVHISNVTYDGLTGTSSSPSAINLNCSNVVACTDLKFNSIQLTSADPKVQLSSNCINAHGTTIGVIKPGITCLQK